MQKNTAGKWIVFAYGLPDHASDGQPITGDAANITANVYIDGAAANAVDDINPAELGFGYYSFDITAAEANGDNIIISPVSSTGSVQVIGVPGAVWTRPPNFEALGIETDGDLTKVNLVALTDLTTTTTNSTQAEADIANLDAVVDTVKAETVLILADTNELQTDDVPTLIANLDAVVDTVKAETVLILADTTTMTDGIITGTAATGTLSTTVATSSLTGYTDDQLIGRIITFLAGPADGESSDITDYASTGGTITFTAMTFASENGNAFKIT